MIFRFIPVVIIVITFTSSNYYSQNTSVYRHSVLNFQFTASDNWKNIWHGTDQIYEVMSPDSILHVKLWHTETEQSAEKYLIKMADMKGLELKGRSPVLKKINGKDFRVLKTTGTYSQEKIRTWLSVIDNGKVSSRSKENNLFIIQLWCPAIVYQDYLKYFEQIQNSVKIR